MPLALQRPESRPRAAQRVTVSSPTFRAGAAIPREQSECGLGISPALSWTAVPGAVSSTIVMEDPDAADPKPVVHWVAWNIPGAITALADGLQERDRLSGGPLEGIMHGATSNGSVGWFGPEPPKGDKPHSYHFQLLALDTMPDLPLGATRDQLLAAANGHVLATGELVDTYAEPASR